MANYLPATYQPGWNYSGVGQQFYPSQYQQAGAAQQAQPAQTHGLIWVYGEVGAKAYQMPQGWPSNQPIALWDTNDTVIYLKSTNPMGMPNPLQKARYTLEEHRGIAPMQTSGDSMPNGNEYVRKDDLERMKQEIMSAIASSENSTKETGRGSEA